MTRLMLGYDEKEEPQPEKSIMTNKKLAGLLPSLRRETRGKNELMGRKCLLFEENASYLFLSLLTSLIATSCSIDTRGKIETFLFAWQPVPFGPLDEPRPRPDPASALTSPGEGPSSGRCEDPRSMSGPRETPGDESGDSQGFTHKQLTKHTICHVHIDKLHA